MRRGRRLLGLERARVDRAQVLLLALRLALRRVRRDARLGQLRVWRQPAAAADAVTYAQVTSACAVACASRLIATYVEVSPGAAAT